MNTNMDYKAARDLLVSMTRQVSTERIDLEDAAGRVLARQLTAVRDVPPFDRSSYDGYAFRAEDIYGASQGTPVTLEILEEVPAGNVPSKEVTKGTAVKILTGAPIPAGADAVIMYEKTDFDEQSVTIYEELSPGDNIVYAGEDIKKGSVLAEPGCIIDAGLSGTLASQGIIYPLVYRKPVVGIISTGSELADAQSLSGNAEMKEHNPGQGSRTECGIQDAAIDLPEGKIINTNRYTLAAALEKDGCVPVYLGTARDDPRQIADLIIKGFADLPLPGGCDMILLTGGVSAGDYDLTPEAMELVCCSILTKGVLIKPGMACCYGVKDEKLVCALSGNPASALTNYYAVVRPAIRKLAGLKDYLPRTFTVILADDFNKKSKVPRILKGKLEFSETGQALLKIPSGQGNVMISSSIGCDCLAQVSAGSKALKAGAKLKAFMI